ncbi:hypothetical protein N320_04009, partial [Buceros rhinoceros silvestris]
ILELKAVVWVFKNWHNKPINVLSDSLYVVGTVQRLQRAIIKTLQNNHLFELLLHLSNLLNQRQIPYFITHIRSHQFTTGLSIGNNEADHLVSWADQRPNVNLFQQARLSHDLFHQSAKTLAKQFHLSVGEARGIVQSCTSCQQVGYGLGLGVNLRGSRALQLWQMDVTHIPELGNLKYVHVSIDTFSHVIWATAQTGETARHVKKHMHAAIAVLGIPMTLKTDNGPAYTSRIFQQFCQLWGVIHNTGIPKTDNGQGIVERAHSTLKTLLQKQ